MKKNRIKSKALKRNFNLHLNCRPQLLKEYKRTTSVKKCRKIHQSQKFENKFDYYFYTIYIFIIEIVTK
jgi:sulfite reductase alpha subunit-like flavoprotein